MSPQQLADFLKAVPSLSYVPTPTRLQPLPRLSRLLDGPHLWVKRDDEIGPGLGGNKGRKLAYLLPEAIREGHTKVVTFGGLQSNHARMTAAACAALGLETHLVFFGRRPPELEGNLLLDEMFGARLHFIPFGGGSDGAMSLETVNRLVSILSLFLVGPHRYFIPVGGHNVTGCLGYVAAALELSLQAQLCDIPPRAATVVTASGTGGTLAGLLAGFTLLGSPLRALGLDIGKLWKGFSRSVSRLHNQLCNAIGEPVGRGLASATLPLIEAQYAGPGYARIDDRTREAIELLAKTEGLLLDPIYTGKAFAGLLDLIRQKRFASTEHVIFLHSGGLPGLWSAARGFQ